MDAADKWTTLLRNVFLQYVVLEGAGTITPTRGLLLTTARYSAQMTGADELMVIEPVTYRWESRETGFPCSEREMETPHFPIHPPTSADRATKPMSVGSRPLPRVGLALAQQIEVCVDGISRAGEPETAPSQSLPRDIG